MTLTMMIKLDERTYVAQEAVESVVVPKRPDGNAFTVFVMLRCGKNIGSRFPFGRKDGPTAEEAEASALKRQQELINLIWPAGRRNGWRV